MNLDPFTKKKRAEIMSKVKSKDTKPELLVRKALHQAGFRYRLHSNILPGKPDIVLKKYQSVIQVRGCFWHSHNCRAGMNRPRSNFKYWQSKLDKNKNRDIKNDAMLEKMGWKVFVVWECCLKNKMEEKKTIDLIISDLRKHLKSL